MSYLKSGDNSICESFVSKNGSDISVRLRYPSFECSDTKTKEKLNLFYKTAAEEYMKFCKTKYAPSKTNDAKSTFSMSWYVPYSDEKVLSVILDLSLSDSKHRQSKRFSHNWDVARCVPIHAKNTFSVRKNVKKLYLNEICSKIHIRDGGFAYRKNAAELAKTHFDFEKFYFTPKGIAFYYDKGLLLGANIYPTFIIPYTEIEGMRYNFKK